MSDKNLTSAIRAPYALSVMGSQPSALGMKAYAMDFREIEMQTDVPVIRAGTYSTPIVMPAASQSLLKMYYSQTRDTGADVVTFFYGKALGDAAAWGDTALVESFNLAAPGPSGLGGGQFMAGLTAGAYLGANAGGAAVANMVGAWCKVYAAADSVTTSACRVAPIWLDNQMSCTINGDEFAAFITAGGTVPDAVFGFSTTSSGWAALLNFDASCVGKAPLSALKTASAASDSSILIKINGVTKYIPVFDAAT